MKIMVYKQSFKNLKLTEKVKFQVKIKNIERQNQLMKNMTLDVFNLRI